MVLCCALLLFLIGLVQRAWSAVTPGGKQESARPFPPPAARTAPGIAPAIVPAAPIDPVWSSGRGSSDALSPGFVGAALRFSVAGGLLYVGTVGLLLEVGAVEGAASPAVGWLARDFTFVGLAVLGLLAARRSSRSAGTARGGERLAPALVGAGSAWLNLGLIDQHLFGLFEVGGGALGWDLLFHGVGVIAFVVGWSLLRSSGSPISGRSFDLAAPTASMHRDMFAPIR